MRAVVALAFYFGLISFSSPTKNIKVYIFMAEECPICNYLGKTLKKTSNEFNDKVEFIAVFPQRISNIKSASIFKKKYGLEHYRIIIDHDQKITKKYDATVTPEVVIVNTNDEVLYQGRINTSYASPGRMRHGKVQEDLDIALHKIVNGRTVDKPWPTPIGCYITRK